MIRFNSENDLETFLFEYWEETGVCLVNNCQYDSCERQFNLGGYGICDLVFYTDLGPTKDGKSHGLHVIELKNQPIQTKDIAQICRYKTAFSLPEKPFREFNFTLVVPRGVGQNSDACYLSNHLEGIEIYEFHLSPISGIQFEDASGWHDNDGGEGIKIIKKRILNVDVANGSGHENKNR